jgi:hypothetical protein
MELSAGRCFRNQKRLFAPLSMIILERSELGMVAIIEVHPHSESATGKMEIRKGG